MKNKMNKMNMAQKENKNSIRWLFKLISFGVRNFAVF